MKSKTVVVPLIIALGVVLTMSKAYAVELKVEITPYSEERNKEYRRILGYKDACDQRYISQQSQKDSIVKFPYEETYKKLVDTYEYLGTWGKAGKGRSFSRDASEIQKKFQSGMECDEVKRMYDSLVWPMWESVEIRPGQKVLSYENIMKYAEVLGRYNRCKEIWMYTDIRKNEKENARYRRSFKESLPLWVQKKLKVKKRKNIRERNVEIISAHNKKNEKYADAKERVKQWFKDAEAVLAETDVQRRAASSQGLYRVVYKYYDDYQGQHPETCDGARVALEETEWPQT